MIKSSRLPFHIAFLLVLLSTPETVYGAISGTVIDPAGLPVEGALVVAVEEESDLEERMRWLSGEPDPARIAEATTDSKGNYTLDLDDELAVATIEISAPGRLPLELRTPHDGWIGASVLREAEMFRGRILSGKEPVAGAVVIMEGSFSSKIRMVTDEEGGVSLPLLDGPFTTVTVVHSDYAPYQKQRFRPQADFTIRLDSGISISGKAVAANGETPVADAIVTVDGWPLATSDEAGLFTISNAPRDWATVRISRGNLAAQVTRATAKSTTVQLRKAATVTGTVVDADSGRGIPQARVTLGNDGIFRSGTRSWTHTDSTGKFSFSSVLPGSYNLTTNHPSWTGSMETLTVVGDDDVDRRIETERTATARGRAIDERGEAVAAAFVTVDVEESDALRFARFRMEQQALAVRSAPDGRFVAFGIPANKPVRLIGNHRSHPAAKSERFELAPGGEETGANIVFPRGVSITGTVTSASGDPISNAEIRVSESDRGGPGGRAIFVMAGQGGDQPTLTDARGRFDVKVTEGAWNLSVTADGFAPASLNAIDTRQDLEPLKIVLEEGVAVQGRVVRAGTGISDVTVLATFSGVPEPVTTGPDGAFIIDDLPRGQVTVLAVKPDEMIREMRMVEAPASDLVIEIPPGGAIRGRVVDESTKEPVTDFQAGASADRSGSVRVVAGTGVLQPFHGDDGEFYIEHVPTGRAQLVIQAPGYVLKTIKGIEIVEGETVDGLEVELSRGVRITGTVRGDDGAPLGGVSIRIEDSEEDPLERMMPPMMGGQASTDSSGRYTIPAAPAGETTLAFRRDGYVTARRTAKLEGKETRVDATLSSGTALSGTVVTQSGAPIAGASVRAVSAVQGTQRVVAESDESGQFTLEGLAEGRYTIVATHPRYVEATREGVDARSGESLRLVMDAGGAIVGRVLGADPSSYDSISVYARASSAGGSSSSPVSPDGTFRIEAVQPGTVQVMARMGRIFNNRSSETATVEVTAGSQVSVDLQFNDGATVSGRITRFGEPLRAGIVRLTPRGGSRSDSSSSIDSDGRFSIGGLEHGTYDLFVIDIQTRAPYSETIEVTSDSQTVDIDIRGGSISGRISDATSGQPVENASISLEAVGGQDRLPIRLSASTGSTGEFVIDSVPEGSYSLRVERTGYGHATRSVFVSEERTESIEISIQPDEGLSLRVVDHRDGRPLAAFIAVYDAQNAVAWEGQPSPREDGTIRIPVSSGTYNVTASASGYAPSTVRISSVGTTETIALSVGGSLVIESGFPSSIRAKLVDSWGMPHRTSRWNRSGEITIVHGTSRLENLAPGHYTLQILNDAGTPVRNETVVIREGETSSISL